MTEFMQHNCPNCGGALMTENEELLRCLYCDSAFENDSFQRKLGTLREFLDLTNMAAVNNQRKNLYDAVVRAKHISRNEVEKYATEIKKLIPDDFQANFYLEALSGDVKKINDLIRGIDAEAHYDLLPPIIHFLITSLRSEFLLELNLLIERAYKKRDLTLYSRYATKLSEEAEKVSSGVYETYLPRDVFIAYSSKDMPVVSRLCEDLENEGFACFVAARNLRHGVGSVENYDSALKEAMDCCTCFLFVSSVNSRKFDCDAVRKEIPYIRSIDTRNAPPEYRFNYKTMPPKYKKPRIEYRIGTVTKSATNMVTSEFFDGYEWVYDTDGVIERLARILTATPEYDFATEITNGGNVPAPAVNPVCTHKNVTVLPAKEATCTADGKTEGVQCADCGEILRQSEPIPARGHSFGAWTVTKPATCTEDGEQERVCDCGKKETMIFPAHGIHQPGEWETVKEPTENEAGLKVRTCSVCGERVASETIPAKQAPKSEIIPAKQAPKSEVIPAKQAPKYADMSAEEMNALGDKYYFGKNYATAVEWYTKAAEQGLADAQNNLGVCYEDGFGVAQDDKKAAGWYTKAAKQGHVKAQFNLAVFYEKGRGVAQDDQKAAEWYAKAAEQGNAVAQYNVGFCYEKGRGVAQDDQKAAEWYAKAAEQGNVAAQYNLGVCYANGRGVAQDNQKAAEWYTKAAEQGNAIAQNNLGFCYEKGRGVAQDDKKAIEWYTKAAEQGDGDAKKALEQLRQKMKNSPAAFKGLRYKVNPDGKTCSVTGQGTCEDTDIVIPETIDGYRVTGIMTETKDDHGNLTSGFSQNITSVVIPKSVTGIGDRAFSGRTSLASVVIPDSVTDIGRCAFQYCTSLTGITIPNSVTSIGDSAFSWCTSLASVMIPDSVTRIGDSAFRGCTSLVGAVIPNSVKSISWGTFYDCKSLASVEIPNSVTSIGWDAFCDCTSLAGVEIPDSVTSIGNGAFSRCTNLASAVIPASVTSMGEYTFHECMSLASLRYKGNKKQWKNLKLDKSLKKYSSIRAVECTDGNIKI